MSIYICCFEYPFFCATFSFFFVHSVRYNESDCDFYGTSDHKMNLFSNMFLLKGPLFPSTLNYEPFNRHANIMISLLIFLLLWYLPHQTNLKHVNWCTDFVYKFIWMRCYRHNGTILELFYLLIEQVQFIFDIHIYQLLTVYLSLQTDLDCWFWINLEMCSFFHLQMSCVILKSYRIHCSDVIRQFFVQRFDFMITYRVSFFTSS